MRRLIRRSLWSWMGMWMVALPVLAWSSTARAYQFGAGPLADVQAAAASQLAATGTTTLAENELAAMMLAITWPECVGNSTTLTPSPMTLGRSDNGSKLYNTYGTDYNRMFFHAGLGLWQMDSAGLGKDINAAQAIDVSTVAPLVAAELVSRWNNTSSTASRASRRATVWGAWHACDSGACETAFQAIYDAADQPLVITLDASVTSTGGMEVKKCRDVDGVGDEFDCYLVDPDRAEGHHGWNWTNPEGAGGMSPLALAFVVFTRDGDEERHWPKDLSGKDLYVSVTRPIGTNARNTNVWSKKQEICTWLQDCVDLTLLIDTTGSMWDDIANVQASAAEIAAELLDVENESHAFRIAVSDYKDFPEDPYGDPGDYPYRTDLPLYYLQDAVVDAVNSLSAGGGNDWPEAVYSAIMGGIDGSPMAPWRKGDQVKRVILVMGDAPPHDPEPNTFYTMDTVVAAAVAGDIDVGSGMRVMEAAAAATAAPGVGPIELWTVAIGYDSSAAWYFQQLSSRTGGEFFQVRTARQVVAALIEALGRIHGGPTGNQPPDVSGAAPSVTKLWPANHQMNDVAIENVTDPDGDAFTIAITGITQDEAVTGGGSGATDFDGAGVGAAIAQVRAERAGTGNDRVYRISFRATDSKGASAAGSVLVCVPHDQGDNLACVDDGQLHDSTTP